MPGIGESIRVNWELGLSEAAATTEFTGKPRGELIEQIGDLSVPQYPSLDHSSLARDNYDPVRALTAELVLQNEETALAEYERYTTVPERERLTITEEVAAALHEKLAGKTVLVTGGTGQIGSRLMEMLAEYNPGRLVSLSRGVRRTPKLVEGAEYVYMRETAEQNDEDIWYSHCPVTYYRGIGDREALAARIKEIKPDIIFHVAAQRSPGGAEKEPYDAMQTNIFGTRNLIEAAIAEAEATSHETGETKVPEIVYASTGKALRPYSPDVYAASKQAAEWLFAKAVAEGQIKASGARFTHVVDNALVLGYANRWIKQREPVRVHDPYGEFYAQSATESAQLCLLSLLEGQEDAFNLSAITNLREPIRLLDMIMGAMIEKDNIVPLYFKPEQGYEEAAYPFLYEPLEMGDASPLISAYEWPVRDGETTDEIDVFSVRYEQSDEFDAKFAELEEAVYGTDLDRDIRSELQALSWARLEGKLATTPERIIMRAVHRIKQMDGRRTYSEEHERTNQAIMAAADRYSSGS